MIGTRGAVSEVKLDGSSPEKTDPEDHAEGVGEAARLRPQSLFLEQRRRRIGLPRFEEDAVAEVFFPDYAAILAMPVDFGEATETPPDAVFSWAQTDGPRAAQILSPASRETEIRFPRPGLYRFAVAAGRHGAGQGAWDDLGDFAGEGVLKVRVLPRGWQRFQLEPEADAFVRQGEPDRNFGANNQIWMKTVNSVSVNRQIFMRFDLAPLAAPVGETPPVVREATLAMRALEWDFAAEAETLFVADDSWSEMGITWNTRPAAGASLGSWFLSPDFRQRIDLTAAVATEAAGDGRISLRHAVLSQRNSQPLFKYGSRENSDPALRPRLEVLVAPDAPDFAAWMAGFPEILVDQRGALDDPDGDGRSNLEEYALGTSPLAPDAGPSLLLEPGIDGGPWRLRLRGGGSLRETVAAAVEHSPDLAPGSWAEIPDIQISGDGGDLLFAPGAEWITGSRGFFRIRYDLLDFVL